MDGSGKIPIDSRRQQKIELSSEVGDEHQSPQRIHSISTDAQRVESAWSRTSDGTGGKELDARLSRLGNAHLRDNTVHWSPPESLNPELARYLSNSVEELNNLLRAGRIAIDETGRISPRPSAKDI
ncbi:hypothetical protein PGH47_30790 [Streptomyces sp. HUAS 31]|uniref:hypothetical protein n=1 Tax=Streptomyces sp. HUAS 31 TaxID=3020055 RepID=UPI00230519AC|nr:hypothetical protein [Streptomyces sp. HUAS 31]WCD99820.1 hypothetical protein PGH47_30790 [Streptomyces sp. HUAS 31]